MVGLPRLEGLLRAGYSEAGVDFNRWKVRLDVREERLELENCVPLLTTRSKDISINTQIGAAIVADHGLGIGDASVSSRM